MTPDLISKMITEDVTINNGLIPEAVGQMQMFRYIENFFKKNEQRARKAGLKIGSGRAKDSRIGCYLSSTNSEMLDAHMWVNVLPDGSVEVTGDKVATNDLFNVINAEFNKVVDMAVHNGEYQEMVSSYREVDASFPEPRWSI